MWVCPQIAQRDTYVSHAWPEKARPLNEPAKTREKHMYLAAHRVSHYRGHRTLRSALSAKRHLAGQTIALGSMDYGSGSSSDCAGSQPAQRLDAGLTAISFARHISYSPRRSSPCFSIFSRSLSMPSMSSSGRGGQPGTYTSTGTIVSAPWIV